MLAEAAIRSDTSAIVIATHRRWSAARADAAALIQPLLAADAEAAMELQSAHEAAEQARCACDEALGSVAVACVERQAALSEAVAKEARLRGDLHAATARNDVALRAQAARRCALARALAPGAAVALHKAAEAADRLAASRSAMSAQLEGQLRNERALGESRRAACAQLESRLAALAATRRGGY
jgi:hypothetical protein